MQICKTCGNHFPAPDLVCSQCHALVHSEELEILSLRSRRLEEDGDFAAASENWQKALTLLPAESMQAEWIVKHLERLQMQQNFAKPPEERFKWAKKLGPLAPIAIALFKAKWIFAIFKLKFLFSFLAFLGLYWTLWGWKFGVGFAVLILIHELGHYIDIRRRGLPAEMPVFLPGLGAYVQWQARGVSLATRAAVSLAGPIAGWFASFVCMLLWWRTGETIYAGLAHVGAWLNLMNLIPVWVLDGSTAVSALDKSERYILLAATAFLGFVAREPSYILVGGGIVYRLFTKDIPPVPSRMSLAYFIFVLALLAGLLRVVPSASAFAN